MKKEKTSTFLEKKKKEQKNDVLEAILANLLENLEDFFPS
jgi:hypothetical protein